MRLVKKCKDVTYFWATEELCESNRESIYPGSVKNSNSPHIIFYNFMDKIEPVPPPSVHIPTESVIMSSVAQLMLQREQAIAQWDVRIENEVEDEARRRIGTQKKADEEARIQAEARHRLALEEAAVAARFHAAEAHIQARMAALTAGTPAGGFVYMG